MKTKFVLLEINPDELKNSVSLLIPCMLDWDFFLAYEREYLCSGALTRGAAAPAVLYLRGYAEPAVCPSNEEDMVPSQYLVLPFDFILSPLVNSVIIWILINQQVRNVCIDYLLLECEVCTGKYLSEVFH